MNEVRYTPIGIVHSPFRKPQHVPIQSVASKATKGSVEIAREYVEGLKDLAGFSHIILIYHCHLSKPYSLIVKPYLDENYHGVFSTRAPARPNPIGLSIVHLSKIEDNILYIQDLDIIDGTPLLDIKPYIPRFDQRKTARIGWLKNNINKLSTVNDDGRFSDKKQPARIS
jgi:tRNA-Thr(GGU) m(6)t(6)A37 methyltransferase TsaA